MNLFWLTFFIFPTFGVGLEGFRWRNTQLYLKFPSIFKGVFLFENDKYPPVEPFDPEFKPQPTIQVSEDGRELLDTMMVGDEGDTENMPPYTFLPMLPEGTVAFPGSRHFLFINEMKFRELFSDMNRRNDQRLVRCFIGEDGGVEPEACICRVVETRPLITGECMYIIQAEDRVRVDKLIQEPGRSYLMGYCMKKEDPIDIENVDRNEKLCLDLFEKLKVYIRLERVHREMLSALMQSIGTQDELEGLDERLAVCISKAVMDTSPSSPEPREETIEMKAQRHKAFCDAVASLLSTPQTMQEIFEGPKLFTFAPDTMQAIFESTLAERMIKLSTILDTAAERKKTSILSGPGTDATKEAAIAAVYVKGMGEGDFSDHGEELYPPLEWWKELSLSQLQMPDEGDLSSNTVDRQDEEDGLIFKADETNNTEDTESGGKEKEVDPFDDLENVMQ